MLKTSAYGLGFQHLPRDLADVNAWKTMFDPYYNSRVRKNYFLSTHTVSYIFNYLQIL